MPDRVEERIYKSGWHFLIALLAIAELKHHKSKVAKVLSLGVIAFHLDGAVADIRDSKPLARKILELLVD